MGNVYGIKILKIKENGLLNDVIFAENKTILPYIYYITKINKFYVENFRKGSIIKEFTILNIFDRKEYSISIEHVESGYFFDSLEYKFGEIPKIERMLRVSKVLEEGLAHSYGIKAQQTILLGSECEYFQSFKNLEDEILKKKSCLYFYDFIDNKIKNLTFDVNNDNVDVKLGIECELVNVTELSKIIQEKIPENVNCNNKQETLIETIQTIHLIENTEEIKVIELNELKEIKEVNEAQKLEAVREPELKNNTGETVTLDQIKQQETILDTDNKENENANELEKIKLTIDTTASLSAEEAKAHKINTPPNTNTKISYNLDNPKEEYQKQLKVYTYLESNPGILHKPTISKEIETPKQISNIIINKNIVSQSKKKILYNDF